ETELSGKAHYLRRLKQEIKTSRQKLQPALTRARQEFAQAKKDMEVARARNSSALILTTLILTFIIGLIIDFSQPANITRVGPTPPVSISEGALADQQRMQSALKFSREEERLSKEGKFAAAAVQLQKAVEIDSNLKVAYDELGYVLYRL